jgi:hypothetical protein
VTPTLHVFVSTVHVATVVDRPSVVRMTSYVPGGASRTATNSQDGEPSSARISIHPRVCGATRGSVKIAQMYEGPCRS